MDAYQANPDSFAPESYADRDLERAAVAASSGAFASMVEPSLLAASECGNMYAGEGQHVLRLVFFFLYGAIPA